MRAITTTAFMFKKMRTLRAVAGAVLFASSVASSTCDNNTPTQPTSRSSGRGSGPILLRPVCTPVGIEIHCTVIYGGVDVTAVAGWSPSADPFSDVETTVATVAAPGVIVPLRPGDISIRVRYFKASQLALHSYAVDPSAPPIPLANYLSGSVRDVIASTPIEGAKVEIIGGPDTGKSDQTRINGYFAIHHMRMGVPITFRASKTGYAPATGTHPGITDDPRIGTPLNDSLGALGLRRLTDP